jgi:hypothetical protein
LHFNLFFTFIFATVKLLSYILAFYVVLLAAVPCCAFDSCPDDKTELAEQHESGDEDCGNCSPFFSCEGCATATVAFEPVQFKIVLTPLLSVYTGYIQTSLPQVDYDFWQPPRLS